MNILPYKLKTTTDNLTSRAGLLAIAKVMQSLQLKERINKLFPLPQSNRGYLPSAYLQTLMLMQNEGSFHLDDVDNLHQDRALTQVIGLRRISKATAIGNWLRKMGNDDKTFASLTELNKVFLQVALHNKKHVTLDIDATEIISNKKDAKYTYKKNQGYMPIVGHIAEIGQVVASDFRSGNTSPAKENFEFIQQCEAALPTGCKVKFLRIDAAGYQSKIIEYCDNNQINYAIRAKLNSMIKHELDSLGENDWSPLFNKHGQEIRNQQTYRTVNCIGDYENPFTLIIQRKRIDGQGELDLTENYNETEQIICEKYIYRAIATNRNNLSDSELIHWYNQRAEDSENRIKELKLDFGADVLPCSDFKANALYFTICALSFNLYALMRMLLPEQLSHHRVTTMRMKLYAMAAKVTKTGREIFVKLQYKNQQLLDLVLKHISKLEPVPI